MIPRDRNPPPLPAPKQPGSCKSCGIAAEIWRVWGMATAFRNGFQSFSGEKRVYLVKTVTRSWSGSDFHPQDPPASDYTETWSGSMTFVYRYDFSGDQYLESASGSGSWSNGPNGSGGWSISYDPETQTWDYTPGSTFGPNPGIGAPAGGWVVTSDTTRTANYANGYETETLSEEYTEEMLHANVSSLLSGIGIGDWAPRRTGSAAIEAYFGGGPMEDPDSPPWTTAIEAADAEIDAAAAALENAEIALEDAIDALALALTERADALDSEKKAWLDFMEAESDYARALVAVETWTRRRDPAKLGEALGEALDAEEARNVLWGHWITARGDLIAALYNVWSKKQTIGNAEANVADANARVANAALRKAAATANRSQAQTRNSVMVRVTTNPTLSGVFAGGAATRVLEDGANPGFVERVDRQSFRWSAALNMGAWTKNPAVAECEIREVEVSISRSGGDYEASSPSFSDATVSVSPDESSTFFLSEPATVGAPSGMGAIFLAGRETRAFVSIGVEAVGGAAVKLGFPEYLQAGAIPRFYLRETAAGSFPGCPVQGMPSKTYTGGQEFDPMPNVLENWQSIPYPGPIVSTFSDDVPGDRRSLLPDVTPYKTGVGPLFHEQFQETGEILSSTSRRWRREIRCGENEVVDLMTLTLSEEFTTAQLRALVDPAYNAGFEPEEPPPVPPVSVDSSVAINWLPPDERAYFRQKVRVSIFAGVPSSFSQLWSVASVPVTWRRVEYDLVAGGMEVKESTVSIEPGSSYDEEFDPQQGKAVRVLFDAEGGEDPRFWDSPFWLARPGD